MVVIYEDRYNALMDEKADLTREEWEDGWHFCAEWDYLLIHPSHPEANCCSCIEPEVLARYAEERKKNSERDLGDYNDDA